MTPNAVEEADAQRQIERARDHLEVALETSHNDETNRHIREALQFIELVRDE